MNMIAWLSEWYKSNCDGDWEHYYGIKIDTIDNPGWKVDIDLVDTYLEDVQFNTVQIYVDDFNWIHCSVVDGIFRGRGSTDKLEEILKIFRQWATENKKYH
ncbi:MAG: rhodanese-related sulfurtransferase [Clostridium sulfidigenes]|uniref:Rhodanese-related sulfurtransferase n=1 Tax=Clostridium sulfidigenes TaxID=318464 RepID=A0A927ZL09_9CLOT|nr:rhodanese-related sulfurtransferase [Clostridium sulfidigenes]